MLRKFRWRILRATYPWFSLVRTAGQLPGCTDIAKSRIQVRFWVLLLKIDFASLIAIALELLTPEYWV